MTVGDAVVVRRQLISGPGQIVILVYDPYINARGAGLAMVAVHTFSFGVLGREGADDGVVLFLGGGVAGRKHVLHILPIADAGQHRQHAGLIQCVLDALGLCQRLAEGGGFVLQKLAACNPTRRFTDRPPSRKARRGLALKACFFVRADRAGRRDYKPLTL